MRNVAYSFCLGRKITCETENFDEFTTRFTSNECPKQYKMHAIGGKKILNQYYTNTGLFLHRLVEPASFMWCLLMITKYGFEFVNSVVNKRTVFGG